MQELFEHTADLGLRATSPDLNTLFAEMATCLTSAMLDNPEEVRPTTSREFSFQEQDREYLLFDWLRALLHHFESEELLFNRFEVAVVYGGLKATAWGEPLDRSRHQLSREVKAVTYHQLVVRATPEGWLAEAIVDI